MNPRDAICRSAAGAAAKAADDYLLHEVMQRLGRIIGLPDLRELVAQGRLKIHRYEQAKFNKAYLDESLVAVWHDPEIMVDGLEVRVSLRCGNPEFKAFADQTGEGSPL
ncbi:hypothetical protein [Pseudomonas sp. 32_A]|uniref:hypothetical protein n=1 Tax=Pseudomonas sp. 32_A TaxID=2813559 RepID=UPI001A9EE1EA|nr:hypothetical protein [Pseudomonas sp. 32_A]